MSLKTYTITKNGISNGNIISQPFTIEVHEIRDLSTEDNSITIVNVCTKNGSENACSNDEIKDFNHYELQGISKTNSKKLIDTFEIELTNVYGSNWSK